MVRSPSGVTRMKLRAVAGPSLAGAVAKWTPMARMSWENRPPDLVVAHLADIGGAAAEGRDADDRVGDRAARDDRRRSHRRVEALRLRPRRSAASRPCAGRWRRGSRRRCGRARRRWRCRGRARRSGERAWRDPVGLRRRRVASGATRVKRRPRERVSPASPAAGGLVQDAVQPREVVRGRDRRWRAEAVGEQRRGRRQAGRVDRRPGDGRASARRCSSSASSQMTLKYWMMRWRMSQVGRPRRPCSRAER